MDKPFYNVRVVKTQISEKTVNLKYCVFEITVNFSIDVIYEEKRVILKNWDFSKSGKSLGFLQKWEKFGILK